MKIGQNNPGKEDWDTDIYEMLFITFLLMWGEMGYEIVKLRDLGIGKMRFGKGFFGFYACEVPSIMLLLMHEMAICALPSMEQRNQTKEKDNFKFFFFWSGVGVKWTLTPPT